MRHIETRDEQDKPHNNHLSHSGAGCRREKLCSKLISSVSALSFLSVLMASGSLTLIYLKLSCLHFLSYSDHHCFAGYGLSLSRCSLFWEKWMRVTHPQQSHEKDTAQQGCREQEMSHMDSESLLSAIMLELQFSYNSKTTRGGGNNKEGRALSKHFQTCLGQNFLQMEFLGCPGLARTKQWVRFLAPHTTLSGVHSYNPRTQPFVFGRMVNLRSACGSWDMVFNKQAALTSYGQLRVSILLSPKDPCVKVLVPSMWHHQGMENLVVSRHMMVCPWRGCRDSFSLVFFFPQGDRTSAITEGSQDNN